MKQVKIWGDKVVNAYQDADLVAKMSIIAAAKDMWYQEWVKSGIGDVGSCCGGNGFCLAKERRDSIPKPKDMQTTDDGATLRK